MRTSNARMSRWRSRGPAPSEENHRPWQCTVSVSQSGPLRHQVHPLLPDRQLRKKEITFMQDPMVLGKYTRKHYAHSCFRFSNHIRISSVGMRLEKMVLRSVNSKRQLPPLPKKANTVERVLTPPEEETAQLSRLDSGVGIGESFNSVASASVRYGGDSPSISSAANPSSASWSWFDGGNSNGTMQATAWGMVIVTAGLGGEIRAYQNFGLPRRVGRQASLFST